VPPSLIRLPETVEEEETAEPEEKQKAIPDVDTAIRRHQDPTREEKGAHQLPEPAAVVPDPFGKIRQGESLAQTQVSRPKRTTEGKLIPTEVGGGKRRAPQEEPEKRPQPEANCECEGNEQKRVRRANQHRKSEGGAGCGRPGLAPARTEREQNCRERPHRGDHVAHRLLGHVHKDRAQREDRRSRGREEAREAEFAPHEINQEDADQSRERANDEGSVIQAGNQARKRDVKRQPGRAERHHRARLRSRLERQRNEEPHEVGGQLEVLQGLDWLDDAAGQDQASRIGVSGAVGAADGKRGVPEQKPCIREKCGGRHEDQGYGSRSPAGPPGRRRLVHAPELNPHYS